MAITPVQAYHGSFLSHYGETPAPRQPRLQGLGSPRKLPPPRVPRLPRDAAAEAFSGYGAATANAAQSGDQASASSRMAPQPNNSMALASRV